jgi:hypothetical protein
MRKDPTFRITLALLAMLITAGAATVASANILISEFRTRGPNGATDEFVEIWNNSGIAVNIGGYTMRASNNAGVNSVRATVPAGTLLNAGCYYLFTNSTAGSGYSGAVPGNTTFTVGITDDGGIAIADGAAVILDQAGMSAGSAYKEGVTLAPTALNNNQSYERKPGGPSGNSLDTNNNATDFTFNAATSNPQNTNSLCLAAVPTRTETWGRVKTFYR